MKLIAYNILLLVILEESYCKTTSSINMTSTSWGYDYSLNDTRGFKVKHDDEGYQFEPFYNNTSSDLKEHNNSRSVYEHFTSPAATNDSQPHSSTNDVINGTSNGTTNSRSNSTVPNKVLFDTSAGGENTTEFRRVPLTKPHTVTMTETQTEAPIETHKTSLDTPSTSHSIPDGDIIRSPNVPSNRQLYKTTFGAPYGSQNTPMYAAPTTPLYYPQAPSYGQIYGPAGGSMHGVPNTPPMGGTYLGTGRRPDGLPIHSMYGYAPQNGQMYGPPNYQMYGPPNTQMYVPQYGPPMGPMYGPPMGGTYGPTGPRYGLQTHSTSMPQNGQMYRPPNGHMYVPQNSQTNGYPTGSLYGSNRNY